VKRLLNKDYSISLCEGKEREREELQNELVASHKQAFIRTNPTLGKISSAFPGINFQD
jgi:ADP-heptose:LPS heptosyltransferase